MPGPAEPLLSRCADEHPFAPFVRTLGRGKRGARSLDADEAQQAMTMILEGSAEPVQTGAFLMLLRVKEESAEEIRGFVLAARARMKLPAGAIGVDLDWPSYAGKRQQHPWFLLAALLLASRGHRVLMHGCEPHARDRLFAAQALGAMGIPPARDWDEVGAALAARNFAYAPLRLFSPRLQELLNLRPLFGLRSPVNTFVRHLNPLRAAASMQSLHHPAYAALHAEAARQLGQPRALIFRGEGGECELRPDADTRCTLLEAGSLREFLIGRQLPSRGIRPDSPSASALRGLWNDDHDDAGGVMAVTGTVAAALLALGQAADAADAATLARSYWSERGTWPGTGA